MNVEELIRQVEETGGTLALCGNRITYRLPPDAAPALLERLRAHREEVLAALRQQCRTPLRVACWHCKSTGYCDCTSCGAMKPGFVWAAGQCVACRARKVLVQ